VDLITAKTGEAPATTLPPSTPVVPETTTVDCAASAPPSDGSGSSKDELVRQVVDALCSDAADHSGPGSGKPGDDRSGPAGVSGSSRTR